MLYLIHIMFGQFLAHQSWRLTMWAYSITKVRRHRPSSTLSNNYISETIQPILVKFYQLHLWGKGKAALGFGADRIKTVVTMATESSHWHIIGKTVSNLRFLTSPRLSGIGMPSPILWSHPLKMQRIVLRSSLLWWELGTNSLITGPGEWLSFRRFTSKLSWTILILTFNQIFVKLVEFGQGQIFHCRVFRPWAFPLTLNGENGVSIIS